MSFLTAGGERRLTDKLLNGGEVVISHFVLAYVPDLGDEPEDREASLPDDSMIVDTRPYTACGYVNEDQLIYSLVMDSDIGDFDFNWVGLVDEEGVLIVAIHLATQQKRKNNGAIPGNTMTRSVLLQYSGVQSATGVSVPVETWQLNLNDRFTGVDERERVSNVDLFGHASFLDESFSVSQADGVYSVASGIGYVGGIRVKNSESQTVNIDTLPTSIWLDASLQGNVSDMTAKMEWIIDDSGLDDLVDDNGVVHYRTKIADIAADGSVTDTRTIYENVIQHEAKDDPHPQYKGYIDTILADYFHTSNFDISSSIHFFATQISPAGFIKANGAAVSRISYATLFSKIGTTFGEGDGATTFNVPDMRGEFLRGYDDGRDVDVDRVFGSSQDDAIRNITGTLKSQVTYSNSFAKSHADGAFSVSDIEKSSSAYALSGNGDDKSYVLSFDASLAVPTADENRPRNMALTAYIKY